MVDIWLQRIKRPLIRLLFILVLGGGVYAAGRGPRYAVYETRFYDTFDTVVTVRGYASGEAAFARGAEAARTRMAGLHRLYDIYHAYEGVNNMHTINQQAGVAPVTVERDIIDLLLLARQGYDLTGGAVNAAMGSVLRVWHEYRAAGTALPPASALTAAAAYMDMDDVVIDEANSTVFLRKAGMSLDVGAMAKAYAAGLALEAAEAAGLRAALINAGGNIVAGAPPLDGRKRWEIGVKDPAPGAGGTIDTVYFHSLALSASGGYERYYTVDGTDYGHIIDPATLMPADRYLQVTVAHENAALADMLSTALFILPYEEGRALADAQGAAVLWVNESWWRYTDAYARMSERLGGYDDGR